MEKINNVISWGKSATHPRVEPATETGDTIDCEHMEMVHVSGGDDGMNDGHGCVEDIEQGTYIRVRPAIENGDGIVQGGMEMGHGSGGGDGTFVQVPAATQ